MRHRRLKEPVGKSGCTPIYGVARKTNEWRRGSNRCPFRFAPPPGRARRVAYNAATPVNPLPAEGGTTTA
jgi:hypothetical protein